MLGNVGFSQCWQGQVPAFPSSCIGDDITTYRCIGTDENSVTLLSSIIPGLNNPVKVIIAGTLVIDYNFQFNFGSRLFMNDGAQIVLNPGVVCHFAGTWIRSCNSMWKGIRVFDNASIIVSNQSKIQDAELMIDFDYNGKISLSDSEFKNCWKIITNQLDFNGGFSEITSIPYTLGAVVNCIFEGGPLKPKFSAGLPIGSNSLYGIHLRKVKLFEVGYALQSPYLNSTNRFKNLAVGIELDQTTLNVKRTTFEGSLTIKMNGIGAKNSNITILGLGSEINSPFTFQDLFGGIGLINSEAKITFCKFNNLGDGVSSESNISKKLTIHLCRFDQVNRAFRELNSSNSNHEVTNNTGFSSVSTVADPNLSLFESGFYSSTSDKGSTRKVLNNVITANRPVFYGIYAFGGKNLIATNNQFTSSSMANTYFAGIELNVLEDKATLSNNTVISSQVNGAIESESGYNIFDSKNTIIHCNSANNIPVGFRFSGQCQGTQFVGNTIGNHQIGLRLRPKNQLNTTIIGTQNGSGNKWSGTFSTGTEAFHSSNFQPINNASRFRVRSKSLLTAQQISDYWPNTIQPALNWFTESSNVGLGGCLTGGEGAPSLSITDNDEWVINNQIDTLQGFTPVMIWDSKWALLQKLEINPSLSVNNNTLNIWYNNASSLNFFKLFRAESQSDSLYAINTANISNWNSLQAQNFALSARIDGLTELYSNEVDPANRVIYWNQINSAKDSLIQTLTLSEGIRNVVQSLRPTRIQNINTLLSSINLPSNIDSHIKTVLELGLIRESSTNRTFTPTQIQTLQNIANLCPSTDGRGVYMARNALLTQIAGTWDDDQLCQSGNRMAIAPTIQTVHVFPNPAFNQIELRLPDGQIESIVLFDGSGKVIKRIQTKSNIIGIQDIEKGFYFGLVEMVNGKKLPFKFVKQ